MTDTNTATNKRNLPRWSFASICIGCIYTAIISFLLIIKQTGPAFTMLSFSIVPIFIAFAIAAIAFKQSFKNNNYKIDNITKTYLHLSIIPLALILLLSHVYPTLYIPPNSKPIGTAKVLQVQPIAGLLSTSFRLEMDIGTTTVKNDIASTGDTLDLLENTSDGGKIVKYYLCNSIQTEKCSDVNQNDLEMLLKKIDKGNKA